MEQPDYIPADPEYRKKVIYLLLLLVLGGILGITLLLPGLTDYLAQKEPETALKTIRLVLVVLIMIPSLFSVYLIRLAVMSMKQGQFPPQGVRVLRDTPLLFDSAARKRAIIILILAVIIFDLCVITAILAYMVIGTFA